MRLDHLLFMEREQRSRVYCGARQAARPVRSFFACRFGELAQLARASALQAEGQGFEPPILHEMAGTRLGPGGSLRAHREGRKEKRHAPVFFGGMR